MSRHSTIFFDAVPKTGTRGVWSLPPALLKPAVERSIQICWVCMHFLVVTEPAASRTGKLTALGHLAETPITLRDVSFFRDWINHREDDWCCETLFPVRLGTQSLQTWTSSRCDWLRYKFYTMFAPPPFLQSPFMRWWPESVPSLQSFSWNTQRTFHLPKFGQQNSKYCLHKWSNRQCDMIRLTRLILISFFFKSTINTKLIQTRQKVEHVKAYFGSVG